MQYKMIQDNGYTRLNILRTPFVQYCITSCTITLCLSGFHCIITTYEGFLKTKAYCHE